MITSGYGGIKAALRKAIGDVFGVNALVHRCHRHVVAERPRATATSPSSSSRSSATALGEMRRVTRPGGAVTAAVWDYAGEMTLLRTFWDAAVALDPEVRRRGDRPRRRRVRGPVAVVHRRAPRGVGR